jgi:hypothetical protein
MPYSVKRSIAIDPDLYHSIREIAGVYDLTISQIADECIGFALRNKAFKPSGIDGS